MNLNPLEKKFVTNLSVFVVLFLFAFYFIYMYFFVWKTFEYKQSIREKEKEELVQEVSRLKNVGLNNAHRGFWYLTDDGTYFFSADEYADASLSSQEKQNLFSDIAKSKIIDKENISIISDENLPPKMKIHNDIYTIGNSTETTKKNLEKKVASGKFTSDELFALSYIYELEGNYFDQNKINKLNCSSFGERCSAETAITIKGRVIDKLGNYIQNANVEILGLNDAKTKTDAQGFYSLKISILEMDKIRIRASKRNYSDGVASVIAVTKNKKEYLVDDIEMGSPITIITLDNKNKTVTGKNNYVKDGKIVINSPQSNYTIPLDGIVHKNKEKYFGVVDVYLYEFTRENIPENLVNLDTFDNVMGYVGDRMITFGMPFVQFFAPNGEELHVLSSNPMILEHKIYHMDLLYNDYDKLYGPLTESDMQFLVSKSKELGGYPIDMQFLIDNNILRFPAFWVYDRIKGVWENVGIQVVSTDGILKSPFYTINNK